MRTFVSNADLWLCLGSFFSFLLVPRWFPLPCMSPAHARSPPPLAPAPLLARPDCLLRPQRSMGGAAQPAGQLIPDLPPGVGQAWRLSAGIAPPPPSLTFPVLLSLCKHFVPNLRDLSVWTSKCLFFVRIPNLVKRSRVPCSHNLFLLFCSG